MQFWRVNEFIKARLRLTFWYIIVSGFLLLAFTAAAIQAERQAFSQIQGMLSNPVERPVLSAVLERRIQEFSSDFRQKLIIFDIGLFIMAGGWSWFLSGRTLKPIRTMVEQQENFAGDVSHELRTPLTTILIETESMLRKNKNLPAPLHTSLTNIKREGQRMTKLVNNLLVMMRSDHGLQQHFTEVNFSQTADEAFASLEKRAKEKKIRYTAKIDNDLWVLGEPDELKQVILILLDNAVKFTQKGSVRMMLQKSGHQVILTVQDSGSGIDPQHLPHIYDRFYRGHSRGKEKGTGLGLAIAKKLVEKHKGRITVESMLSQGTTFQVRLPLL